MAHTDRTEGISAALKRGYYGAFHRISTKHLQRYVNQFATRYNLCPQDTATFMGETVARMVGKRLTDTTLTARPLAATVVGLDRVEPW